MPRLPKLDFSKETPEERELRHDLILRNRGLAGKFARIYLERYPDRGMSFDELYAAGCEGLTIAAARFDRSRNVKFSTYACWWIRQAIQRQVASIMHIVTVPKPHKAKSPELAQARERAILANERGAPSYFVLEEVPAPEDEDEKDGQEAKECMEGMIAGLPEKYKEILWRRAHGYTLVQIGYTFGITKERVRQIEQRAIELLRARHASA